MIPLADGGDTGGSLRNPASFCNIVGFRPSPGRVPRYPTARGWSTLSVHGPMARTVQDIALMMQAISGYDMRSPISLPEPSTVFAQPLERDFTNVKIAWSRDLGELPIEPSVTATIEKHLPIFKDLGCELDEGHPDFSSAYDIFQTLRAQGYVTSFGSLFEEFGAENFKETIRWNTELGMSLTVHDINRA